MRSAPAILVFAALGCTAQNPAFGDATTGGASTGTLASSGTTTTSDLGTTASGDAATSTSGGTTTTAVEPDDSSTGEPSRHCCGPEDCTNIVRECMCELSEQSCCGPEWGEECRHVAISCGGVCDGEIRDCCVPHVEPACTGVALIPGFCVLNLACCMSEWLPSCVVTYAATENATCEFEPCGLPHASPGCDDGAVVDCVCGSDDPTLAGCCTETWSAVCVEAAKACL